MFQSIYDNEDDKSPWKSWLFPYDLLIEFLKFNSSDDNLNLALSFPNITMMKASK